ncbi:hypothetical protein Y032_0015g2828 [Ancylostoma ceylanicum]|uniref:Phlebovirus glycoprotein G2 fusion domain-containing protein n=2 Tax=Ancylostoma ceylanicum TaxID=53326 RepID=A0A016V9U1_9BILA|nr:hypothetical protein Y032_0015g2828 [Ancylostoma ceylanicum]
MVTVGLCENRLASAIGELESAKGQVSENLLDPYASGESASEQIHQLQQRQEAILSHISRIEEALSMVRERHNLLIQQISTSTSQETDLHAYEAFAEEHNLNQVQVEAETLLHTLKAIAGVDSETLHSIRIQQLDNTIHEGPTTTQATTTSQHPSGPPQTTHDPSHTVADLQSETVQQLDNLHVETPIQQTVTTIKPVKKSAVASHRPHLSIQLEKLRLPTFDGDATKFQHFWCSFELAVHNDDSIDLNMKYLYLQSLIKGEAKVVLQDLVPGECNYYHLVQTLKKRYDCPRKTRALLHHQLYQLPPSTDAASDMRSTWFRVSGILHSLQRFEDLNKVVSIIDLVRSKFPLVIQEKLNDAEFQRGTDFDLKQAMVHLDNIISSRERFEYTCARSNIFNVNRDQNAHNPQSCSQSLNVNYDPSRCCFCNSPLHNSRRCNCYSCASTNMKSNFLTKERGPPNRKQEPLTFDNNCNEDPWIIKQRSTVACESKCFKWQQLLNNSGSFSMMTIRGCYDRMFDMMNPSTAPIPDHNFCTVGEVQLSCLSDASVIEHSCWCEGDYCNAVNTLSYAISTVLVALLIKF